MAAFDSRYGIERTNVSGLNIVVVVAVLEHEIILPCY